jgi:hypothetical protein
VFLNFFVNDLYFKDFPGDSYQQHNKCVSEEERYSAKGWQPKPNANKVSIFSHGNSHGS